MMLSMMMRSAMLAAFVASSTADLSVSAAGDTTDERALKGLNCDNGRELKNKKKKRTTSPFTYYIEYIGIDGKFGSSQKRLLESSFVSTYNEFIGGCSDETYQRVVNEVRVTAQCLFDNKDDTRLLESVADQNHRSLPRNRKRSYLKWDGTVTCGNACEDEDDPLFEDALDARMLMHNRALKNKKQTPAGSGTCCKYNNRRILKGNKPRCKPCPLVDEFQIEFNRDQQSLVEAGSIREFNKLGDITPEVPDIDVCNF